MEPRLMPFSVIKSDKLNSLPMNSLLCTLYNEHCSPAQPSIHTVHTFSCVEKFEGIVIIDMRTHWTGSHLNSTLVLYFFHLIRFNRCNDLPNAAAAAMTTMAVLVSISCILFGMYLFKFAFEMHGKFPYTVPFSVANNILSSVFISENNVVVYGLNKYTSTFTRTNTQCTLCLCHGQAKSFANEIACKAFADYFR